MTLSLQRSTARVYWLKILGKFNIYEYLDYE